MEHRQGQVLVVGTDHKAVATARALISEGIATVVQSEDMRKLVDAFQALGKASRTGLLIVDADTALRMAEHERSLNERFEFDLVKLGAIMEQREPVEKKKMPFYHHKRRF